MVLASRSSLCAYASLLEVIVSLLSLSVEKSAKALTKAKGNAAKPRVFVTQKQATASLMLFMSFVICSIDVENARSNARDELRAVCSSGKPGIKLFGYGLKKALDHDIQVCDADALGPTLLQPP